MEFIKHHADCKDLWPRKTAPLPPLPADRSDNTRLEIRVKSPGRIQDNQQQPAETVAETRNPQRVPWTTKSQETCHRSSHRGLTQVTGQHRLGSDHKGTATGNGNTADATSLPGRPGCRRQPASSPPYCGRGRARQGYGGRLVGIQAMPGMEVSHSGSGRPGSEGIGA